MKFAVVLFCLGCGAIRASASPTVLYATGWEAAANPTWTTGNLVPQNSWFGGGFPTGDNARHRVVAAGTAEAAGVMPAGGTQFHRFSPDPSASTVNIEYAWADLTGLFTNRPAGADILMASIDLFVPAGELADNSLYGLLGFDDRSGGNHLDFGFFIVPSTRSIRLLLDGIVVANSSAAFAYGTWFTLALRVDFRTGAVTVLRNGSAVPELTGTNSLIVGAVLTDVDLFCQNSTASPNPRVVFSDNYLVTVEPPPVARPVLNIAPGAIGEWHLSWSANFADWILESSQDISATLWTNEGATPNLSNGVASVDVTEAPPHTFYRLRKP